MIKNGTIVKFRSNQEPCIIYRVIDDTKVLWFCDFQQKECEHIAIELMGLVPLELLVEAEGHPQNSPAIDVKLNLQGQSN